MDVEDVDLEPVQADAHVQGPLAGQPIPAGAPTLEDLRGVIPQGKAPGDSEPAAAHGHGAEARSVRVSDALDAQAVEEDLRVAAHHLLDADQVGAVQRSPQAAVAEARTVRRPRR